MRNYQQVLFLKNKTMEAIKFIKNNKPQGKYFLAFSGGKDSCVIYDLSKKAKVKFESYCSLTTIDVIGLVKFIRKNYPDVKFLTPRKSFFELVKKKGCQQ